MPNTTTHLVINTGPLLAIIAATGDLEVLKKLYRDVYVPWEVCQEIQTGGTNRFGIEAFENAIWLKKEPAALKIAPLLSNSLDTGEASVIQLALDRNISTVCIDETVGRRIARLSNLSLTGSLGVLLRARREGQVGSLHSIMVKMKDHGIWISDRVINNVLILEKEIVQNKPS